LLLKAVRKHVKDAWARLYIERWLKAPAVTRNGQAVQRDQGVPQGSVIGPALMNLYMHYAFDAWMQRAYPRYPFARYADDAVAHCRSRSEAESLLAAIRQRLRQCKLELHAEKSAVVYCKESGRRKEYPRIQFTFLGYTFRPRRAQGRDGKAWSGFLPAVSAEAIQRMTSIIREWNLAGQTRLGLHEIAARYNSRLSGWLNYYGRFHRWAMARVFARFDRQLKHWAQRKYRRLRRHSHRATGWLQRMHARYPRLFIHWLAFGGQTVRTMGAV
jgi:group II intron reverse transcriptase/maturase